MNKVLQLKNVDIKYWIDEFPKSEIIMQENKSNKFEVNNKIYLQPQKLAMEIYLHRNASNYGILGVEYIPKHGSEMINVEIFYVRENCTIYESELLEYSDYIYYGLPKEYVNEIMETIKLYMDAKDFSGGSLIFNFAVNSEVGSSPKFFEIITEMLLEFIVKRNTKFNALDSDSVVKEIFMNSAF